MSVVAGVAAMAVGAALTFKPFSSLGALTVYTGVSLALAGLAELRSSRATGGVLIATGVVALLAPGLTVRALAIVVGAGMVLGGAARLATGGRGDGRERYAAIAGGAAGVVGGALALAWPDVTILVIALLVGPVTVVLGALQVVRAVRGARRAPRRHPWLRAAGATGALVLALALAAVSALLHRGEPTVDAFYRAPGDLPSAPGRLLRGEPFTRAVPAGARAWRILYTTRAVDGSITVASGLVVVPRAPSAAPRDVVLWNHGTTGIASKCAPSLLRDGFAAGATPALPDVVRRGWALVAPDYAGLGVKGPHPYLIGVPEARSSLDAVRAARALRGADLGRRTVVWGHSQGGGAALWVGQIARAYAPDVPLAGVAALAPASDARALAAGLQTNPSGMLFATFVVRAYSQVYPDVHFDDYVRPTARKVVDAVAGRCLSEPATLLSLPAVLTGERIYSRDLTTGPLGTRLAENTPSRPSGVPTLIGQGLSDQLVLPPVQMRFARRLCAAGQQLDYRTFAGRDHIGVVAPDSPLIAQLLRWTGDRFAGRAAQPGCRF